MPPARAAFYLATLGGIVLAARSVLAEPPPLWASVLAAGLYLALVLAGVLVLRLRMFADAIVRGPEGARGVAITIDGGPDPEHTPAILELLERHGAEATFFVVGRRVDAHPELARAISRGGHALGVQGYEDDPLLAVRGPRMVRRELARAVRAIEKATRAAPLALRPRAGRSNPTIARIAEQLELSVVGWSTSAASAVEDGDIVRVPSHRAALELGAIFTAMDAKNLRVARLGDWIDALEA